MVRGEVVVVDGCGNRIEVIPSGCSFEKHVVQVCAEQKRCEVN